VPSLDEYSVEIYDPKTSSYTRAFPDLETVDESSLIQRFSKVWRVRVLPLRPTESAVLALPSRAYNEKEGYAIKRGGMLRITENYNQHDSTAFTVWDGGLLLADYLQTFPELVKGKTVLELGSGMGLAGLVAAALGAKYVLLTDLSHVVDLLKRNIQENESLWRDAGCQDVQCAVLDWFNPDTLPQPFNSRSGWDVIILADCVWTLDLVAPLMNTLKALLDQRNMDGGQEVLNLLISYQRRGHHAHEAFWNSLSEIFHVEQVDTSSLGIPLPNPKLLLRRCAPK
jgi:predicted nicotinamide N-methyase